MSKSGNRLVLTFTAQFITAHLLSRVQYSTIEVTPNLNLTDPEPSSEHMNWITGHGMQGGITESERQRTYGQDPDVKVKYEIVNRIQHPWLKR